MGVNPKSSISRWDVPFRTIQLGYPHFKHRHELIVMGPWGDNLSIDHMRVDSGVLMNMETFRLKIGVHSPKKIW